MTINTHGFEPKDLQAYRGLAYDHLNKIPLTEDLSLINAALSSLATHHSVGSELSPSLQYRVEKLQDIMDCIQEKIKYFEGKQKELSTNAEKYATESLYDFIRDQRDEGKWDNNWKMEALLSQDSVIVHYLEQRHILSRKDLLKLTVYEFIKFGQAWLEPLYQAEKTSSGQTILTFEEIQKVASAHPKFQTIEKSEILI